MNRLPIFFLLLFSSLAANETILTDWDRYDEGVVYIEEIRKKHPDWIAKLTGIDENISSPLFDFDEVGEVSPSTLEAVKLFSDLDSHFGKELSQMHIVELSNTPSAIEKYIHDFVDVGSFQSKGYDESDSISADILIINDVVKLSENLLNQVISASQYGISSGVIENENFSLGPFLTFLQAHGKRGTCVCSAINEDFEQYSLSWKSADIKKRSSLKNPLPYNAKLKTKKHVFVTYRLSGGRLGDNLLAYSRAKWAAMKFGLPMIVKPFRMFEEFELSKMDFPFRLKESIKHKIDFKHLSLIPKCKKNSVITIPYYSEYPWGKAKIDGKISRFQVDWSDPKFKKEFKKCLSPTRKIPTVLLPKDKITIAIHIRRGGTLENHHELNIGYPLKAPNDDYYIQLLNKLTKIYEEKQIYVYIFTDDTHPEKIANTFAKAIDHYAVTFDWNKKGAANSKDAVLKDFFSIGEFDCLIRSASNFSVMAGKRGDYLIETSPLDARIEKNKSHVTKYEIIFGTKVRP